MMQKMIHAHWQNQVRQRNALNEPNAAFSWNDNTALSWKEKRDNDKNIEG